MEDFLEGLVPLLFFSGTFYIIYFIVKSKHQQRQYILENELSPHYFEPKQNKYYFWTLRLGMLIAGAPLGIILTKLFEGIFSVDITTDIYISNAFLFTGILWVVEFFIEKKIIDSQSSKD